MEPEFHLVLHGLIDALKNFQIVFGAQMLAPGLQQVQVILKGLDLDGPGLRRIRGIDLRGGAVGHVDGIHVVDELHQLFPVHVVGEPAAELCGKVIFSVREGAGTAKAGHNGTGLAANAGLHLAGDNGTATGINIRSLLQNQNLQIGPQVHQLIPRKNAGLSGADDRYIITHNWCLLKTR